MENIMIDSIRLGTAGYYRMRGLLHPALNDQMPDNEILLAPATVVRKAIANYFDIWNIQLEKSDFVIDNLSLIELEKLMELVTITVIDLAPLSRTLMYSSLHKFLAINTLNSSVNEFDYKTQHIR